MRVLALVSSYRKNGNTSRIVRMIEAYMQTISEHCGEPLEFETLYLAHMDIQPCRGCRICFDVGEEKCPLRDDLLAIKAEMQGADAVVLASPVYVNDVNGIAKNWIDRLAHVCHRPAFPDKCAYLIATVGNGPTRLALRLMKAALLSWGFYIVGQTGFKTGALMEESEMAIRYEKKTQSIATALFWAIKRQRFKKPSFLSLMTFRIQQQYWQQNDRNSVDYRYWESCGWLEPRRAFYIRHHVNHVKVILARLSGALLARFVT